MLQNGFRSFLFYGFSVFARSLADCRSEASVKCTAGGKSAFKSDFCHGELVLFKHSAGVVYSQGVDIFLKAHMQFTVEDV